MFLCFGLIIGLWGGSVAEVARFASITPEVIGSAFLGYAVAGILGMAVIGRIGGAVSLKKRLLILLAITACCTVALFHASTSAQLIAGLFVFSFLMSSIDLVMNSEALAVEKDRGAPVLSGFHGLASLGVAIGALAGSYLSVTISVGFTALTGAAVFALAAAAIAIGTPDRGPTHAPDTGSSWFRPSLIVIGIGLVLGVSTSGELAATMFSAQTLTSQAPELAAYAGFGATAFALFQSAVRLTGDRWRALIGDRRLIVISLAATLAGFAVVAASSSVAVSALGFAMVGIGTACIVPCCFATAARLSGHSAAATISMIAIVSGLVRIPAPFIYGVAAEATGFAPAFTIYALLAATALTFALLSAGGSRIRRPA